MASVRKARQSETLRNHDIVVIALYLLGGATTAVDTEDIAIRANLLAPGRFVWHKYPEQVNLETIRVFLSDAKKEKNGSLVSGSGTEGWRLTRAGLRFAQEHPDAPRTGGKRRRGPKKSAETTWLRAERKRLLNSDACAHAAAHGIDAVGRRMAEEFFRVDDYITGKSRDRKITRILDAFGRDHELGELVTGLAAKLK